MASNWLNFLNEKKKKKNEKIKPTTSRWAGERIWEYQNQYLLCIGRIDEGTSSWLKSM